MVAERALKVRLRERMSSSDLMQRDMLLPMPRGRHPGHDNLGTTNGKLVLHIT